MDNPFTWDNLTMTPAAEDVFRLPAIVFFAVFAIGFVASAVMSNHGARRFGTNPVKRRAIQHLAGIALYVFGAGLFFFGVRALNINPFSFGSPIWMWLSVLAVVVLAVYSYRYWTTTYPARLRAYEQRKLKEQYLKPAKSGSARAARSVTKPAGTGQASKSPPV